MKEPVSILEFQQRFKTDEDCLQEIIRKRWPSGFQCPHCGSRNIARLSKRRAFQCNSCRKQTSITAGTIFEKTRIPLLKWFYMIFLIANDKGGASALRLTKLLGMRYDTVWHIVQKLRAAMGERDELYQLCGSIEIDEGFFGGSDKGGRRGRGAKKKVPVLVFVESKGDSAGMLKMQVLECGITMPSIRETVDNRVKPAQFFEADGFGVYGILSAMGHRVTSRKTLQHEQGKRLVWVHKAISLAKRFILGTYHGVSGKHLQHYLDEFCFRWNRRRFGTGVFMRLVATASWCAPIEYAALTG
jgi:transposase-like protein